LWWGLVGLSLSVGLFCAVPALAVTLPAAAICGVFGSWLCIAVPAALARAHGPETGPAAITEAHAVAAFVGVAGPLAGGGAGGGGRDRMALRAADGRTAERSAVPGARARPGTTVARPGPRPGGLRERNRRSRTRLLLRDNARPERRHDRRRFAADSAHHVRRT